MMTNTPRSGEGHDGLGALSIREVVESALEQEDIMPVVRLVFDAPPTQALPSGHEDASDEEEDEGDDEDDAGGLALNGRLRKRGAKGRDRGSRAAAVVAMLQQVSEEQVQEIAQVCRSHTDEIAGSMQELEGMQAAVEELREQVGEAQGGLQASGEGLLKILDMLQEASRVLAAIRKSRKALELAIRLLQMTAAAGHFLQENRLYKSFRLLQRVRDTLPESSANDESKSGPALSSARGSLTRTMSAKGAAELAAPTPEHSSGRPQLGNLQKVLLERVDMLTKALEQKAITDFNDWLVSVRAEAQVVGMRVLCRAAAERAREEAAARQRRALLAQLPAAAEAGRAPAVPAASEGGGASEALWLDPKANPAAAEILANPPPDSGSEVLGSINMTLLLRCVQVHECLGKLQGFQESYQRNRRLQLNSDLAPPANFSEGYRPFVAQLAGFFIIEDRVQRRCHALCAGAQADAGWETAVAVLKTVLNIAFDTTTSAGAMLRMKDFVLLVCSALGNCGYHVVPVQEILMSGRAKYQELLCTALAAQLAAQVAQPTSPAALALWAQVSPLLPAEVPDEGTAAAMRALGLPLTLSGEEPPASAFAAPFSGVVPFLLRLFRSFVEDCVAYLTGLVSSAEVLPVVRQQRDKMLSRVAIGALQASLDALSMRDLGRAMQAVTDAWALGAAMPALDDFTHVRARGGEMRERVGNRSPRKEQRGAFQVSGPSTSSGAASLQAQWAGLQEAAERVVVRVLAGQSSSFLSQARAAAWLPELPPKAAAGASPYINEILDFLTDSLNLGARMLPREPYCAVARAAITFLGDAIMDLLAEDAIPAYNMYALQQLSKDVAKLKAFAEACNVPDMAEGLAEPEQFCRLMTTNTLEELVDAKQRSEHYSAINFRRLCSILTKYREIGDKASYTGSHSVLRSKQPESILKRKQVDKVMKVMKNLPVSD
ncbi:Exocyst complex component 6B [Coccomyxa sp. Obi]|nr:Exocyst complex component 6B [Coccomyxa sp. Obi]